MGAAVARNALSAGSDAGGAGLQSLERRQPRVRLGKGAGSMDRLAGKVAIVTGAGNGIGRSTAHAMAGEGAAVLVADRDTETGSRVAAGIAAQGGKAAFQLTDVGQTADVEQMVAAAVDRWGRLDILVNNA